MNKFSSYIIIAFVILLASCNSSNKEKAASADTINIVGNNAPDTTAAKESTPTARTPADSESTGNDEILRNIDNYLVSKIENGILTLENKLPDAIITKAVAQVTGPGVGPDYYNLINIDPGGSKTVRVKSNVAGQVCHIVKLSSNELTGGETILVGDHYTPK